MYFSDVLRPDLKMAADLIFPCDLKFNRTGEAIFNNNNTVF